MPCSPMWGSSTAHSCSGTLKQTPSHSLLWGSGCLPYQWRWINRWFQYLWNFSVLRRYAIFVCLLQEFWKSLPEFCLENFARAFQNFWINQTPLVLNEKKIRKRTQTRESRATAEKRSLRQLWFREWWPSAIAWTKRQAGNTWVLDQSDEDSSWYLGSL